jgi:hypothetical protein
MPIRKFRDVSEMEGNTWRDPGTPELFRAIRSTWDFATRTVRPRFPAGVYKHRSIEAAKAQKEEWGKANFEAYQERLRSQLEESEGDLRP